MIFGPNPNFSLAGIFFFQVEAEFWFQPQVRGPKARENAFQTIPHISFFDAKLFSSDVFFGFFRSQNYRKIEDCLFLKSWEFLDVTGRAAMKNDPK